MKRLAFIGLALLATCVFAGDVYFGGAGSGSIVQDRSSTGGTLAFSFLTAPSTAPACVGAFFADTFTESGTGNINLADSTTNDWEGTDATDGSIVIDRSNDEIKSTNTGGVTKTAFTTLTANCSNYSVTGSMKTGSTGNSHRVGVLGRWINTSGGNGYRGRIEGDGTVRLEKVTNGTSLDLDTDTIAGFSSSTYYSVELRMAGSTISVYVGGVLECTASDSAHVTPGSVGVLLRNGNIRLTSVTATYL